MSRIVCLVPAHNEAKDIEETVRSLCEQTHQPDLVLVISDNSTDDTVAIVRRLMDEYPMLSVMETVGNKAKKAGALNQGIATLNPIEWDYLLQMDADTTLDSQLIEQGLKELERNPNLGGVCSRCFPKPYPTDTPLLGRILWRFQNLEYGFSDSRRVQDRGHVKVLPGAVCIYRMHVLREVIKNRRPKDPVDHVVVWPENSLVEDYELTLDVQKIGYETEAGYNMFAYTDAMFTLQDLYNQRKRWYGGTAATIRRRGFASEIRREIGVQTFYVAVILARVLMIWLLIQTLTVVPITQLDLRWWLPVIGLIMVNYIFRFRYVRNKDVGQWFLVMTLIPLEIYVTWDQLITLVSYGRNFFRPSTSW